VYVKAGLEDRKAALLVAVAGLSDGRKVCWRYRREHGSLRTPGVLSP